MINRVRLSQKDYRVGLSGEFNVRLSDKVA